MVSHQKNSFSSPTRTGQDIKGASRETRAPFVYRNVNPWFVTCDYGRHHLTLLGYFILLKSAYPTGFITKGQAKAFLICKVLGINRRTVWSKLEEMEAEGWIEFKKNGFIRLLSTRIKDNKNGRKNLKINIEKGDGTRDIIQKLREAIISKTIRKQNYILRKETNSQIKHVATGLISDIPLGVKGMSEVLRCSKSTASREKKNFRFITTRHKISFHKNMSEAELLYFQTDEPSGKWIRLRNGDVMHQQADLFTLHKKPIAKAKKVKAPKGKGFSVTNGGSAAVKTEEEYKEMSLDDCKLEAAIAQHEFDEKYGTHRWRSFNRRACRD